MMSSDLATNSLISYKFNLELSDIDIARYANIGYFTEMIPLLHWSISYVPLMFRTSPYLPSEHILGTLQVVNLLYSFYLCANILLSDHGAFSCAQCESSTKILGSTIETYLML